MRFPRLTLILLISALGAWCAGALYTWFADPEMKFWVAAARQKLDWVEEVRAKHGYVIGVVGGSTTTFGIDAEYIEKEHGLPVANLGLHIGMGPEACIGFGFSALSKGDTLVLSLEPAAFTEDYPEESKLGSKLALLLGRPEVVAWDNRSVRAWLMKSLFTIPPGGYHVMTMLGKVALGMPPYRYIVESLRPGGLQVTTERRDFTKNMDFALPEEVPPLSERSKQLLGNAQSVADERGINLIYILPWSYWPRETANERRTANTVLLDAIGRNVRVLREPPMGVHSELNDFADSGQHLTAEAAAARSSVLAETLKADRESLNHQKNPRE
jgi:hypothetical protein